MWTGKLVQENDGRDFRKQGLFIFSDCLYKCNLSQHCLTGVPFSIVQKVSLWSKIHLWYDFFFVGKVAAHTVTFIYYCFAIPVSVLFPEIQIPLWGVVYVPTVITLLKALGTPR